MGGYPSEHFGLSLTIERGGAEESVKSQRFRVAPLDEGADRRALNAENNNPSQGSRCWCGGRNLARRRNTVCRARKRPSSRKHLRLGHCIWIQRYNPTITAILSLAACWRE
jgi:hypothetical protein